MARFFFLKLYLDTEDTVGWIPARGVVLHVFLALLLTPCFFWTVKMWLVMLHPPSPTSDTRKLFFAPELLIGGRGCWKKAMKYLLTPDLQLCPHRQVYGFSHCHELKSEWGAQREGASALGRGWQQQWWLWPRVWHGTVPFPENPRAGSLSCLSVGCWLWCRRTKSCFWGRGEKSLTVACCWQSDSKWKGTENKTKIPVLPTSAIDNY